MGFFKKKKEEKNENAELSPTLHVAALQIVNEHFGINEIYDLSDLSFTEITDVLEFINFKRELRDIMPVDLQEEIEEEEDE